MIERGKENGDLPCITDFADVASTPKMKRSATRCAVTGDRKLPVDRRN
jgi:hypothetical protein